MNWISFLRLMRTIYGKRLPDLNYIQKLGLLAVKIGQTYALRADFLPEDSCKHLANLYRNTEKISPADINRMIDEYTDPSWRDNFSFLDENPLASASVGQVHRGRLKTNRDVVIKIIKSDYRMKFLKDVNSLKRFIGFVLLFYPKLRKVADPQGILGSIEKNTLDELDLKKEVSGQKTLKNIVDQNKNRYDLSAIKFPVIYESLSNSNVMVSEFVEGKTFDEMLRDKSISYEILLKLFQLHGFFVFCIGTFHGDIHPGNIIYRDGKIYFLDTGAISTVSKKMRNGLFRFFEALADYDYPKCAHFLNKMAYKEIEGGMYESFRKNLLLLYEDYTNTTVSEVSLTKKMMQTIKLGVNSGMVFEKGMYPIIKSLMYLDGMVLRCNPDAVLVRDMKKFIHEFEKHVN